MYSLWSIYLSLFSSSMVLAYYLLLPSYPHSYWKKFQIHSKCLQDDLDIHDIWETNISQLHKAGDKMKTPSPIL